MPAAGYRDFQIQIDEQLADESYPVTVRVPAEEWRAEGLFRSPFRGAEVSRASGWLKQGLFDADHVREFGTRLFRALFVGDVKQVYDGPVRAQQGREPSDQGLPQRLPAWRDVSHPAGRLPAG